MNPGPILFVLCCAGDFNWLGRVGGGWGGGDLTASTSYGRICHEGSVAERSKALDSGTSLFWGVGSYPTAANAFKGAVS